MRTHLFGVTGLVTIILTLIIVVVAAFFILGNYSFENRSSGLMQNTTSSSTQNTSSPTQNTSSPTQPEVPFCTATGITPTVSLNFKSSGNNYIYVYPGTGVNGVIDTNCVGVNVYVIDASNNVRANCTISSGSTLAECVTSKFAAPSTASTYSYRAFIDLNQNGIFDSTEPVSSVAKITVA